MSSDDPLTCVERLASEVSSASEREGSVPREEQWAAFGAAVLRERTRLGLTQRAVAKAVGVAPSAVAKWERGGGGAKPANVKALEELFGVDDGELGSIIGQDPPPAAANVEAALAASDAYSEEAKAILLSALRAAKRSHRADRRPVDEA